MRFAGGRMLAKLMSGHPTSPEDPRHQLNSPLNFPREEPPARQYGIPYGDGSVTVPTTRPTVTPDANQWTGVIPGQNRSVARSR